jgi:hypothetical protein
LPWFRSQRYQGVLIEGEWFGIYPGYSESEEGKVRGGKPHLCKITLKQIATQIRGEIVELDGPDRGKRYDIEGDFRDLILTLKYRESNMSRIDRGTIALCLRENGEILRGHTLIYSDSSNEIKCLSYIWARTEDALNKPALQDAMTARTKASDGYQC